MRLLSVIRRLLHRPVSRLLRAVRLLRRATVRRIICRLLSAVRALSIVWSLLRLERRLLNRSLLRLERRLLLNRLSDCVLSRNYGTIVDKSSDINCFVFILVENVAAEIAVWHWLLKSRLLSRLESRLLRLSRLGLLKCRLLRIVCRLLRSRIDGFRLKTRIWVSLI